MKPTHIVKYLIVEPMDSMHDFPIDMLRYDSCSPLREEDSNEIRRERGPKRRVALRWFTEPGGAKIASARWESYGWTVVAVTPDRGEAYEIAGKEVVK